MRASAVLTTRDHRWRHASALIFTAIAALITSAAIAVVPAAAQTADTLPPGDTPSVGVTPTNTKQTDPNAGQWFVFKADPGATVSTEARIGNPATIPQTIKLYLADLVFGADGTPSIPAGDPTDIGKWGQFDEQTVTIPPHQFVRMRFELKVPEGADPGDHVGAVVAESLPEASTQNNALKIVKRVATRLYVTVSGDATKSYKITNVTKKLSSRWGVPTALGVTTFLTNTGRVRLNTVVAVNGVRAKGPDVLLARSVEHYVATVRAPWYGGPVTAHVKVDSEAGTKTVAVSLFVIPWGTLAMIPLAVLCALGLRELMRWRRRRMRALMADVRRLESMVTERQTGEAAAMAALSAHKETLPPPAPAEPVVSEQDQVGRLREAFKRAQRTGSQEGLESVSLLLHAAGVDARADLRVALEHAEGDQRELIEAALFSYEEPEVVVAPEPEREPEWFDDLQPSKPQPEPTPEPEWFDDLQWNTRQVEPQPESQPEFEPDPEPEPDDGVRSSFLEHLQDAFDD